MTMTMLLWQMTKRLQKTLENTRFAGCPVIAIAAKPTDTEVSVYCWCYYYNYYYCSFCL